jgi:hypothetical protein
MIDMATEIEYRERAKECIELAILARSPEQRIMLQHIAETWVRLADVQTRAQSNATGFHFAGNGTVHGKA